jgi:hypothetical protein
VTFSTKTELNGEEGVVEVDDDAVEFYWDVNRWK